MTDVYFLKVKHNLNYRMVSYHDGIYKNKSEIYDYLIELLHSDYVRTKVFNYEIQNRDLLETKWWNRDKNIKKILRMTDKQINSDKTKDTNYVAIDGSYNKWYDNEKDKYEQIYRLGDYFNNKEREKKWEIIKRYFVKEIKKLLEKKEFKIEMHYLLGLYSPYLYNYDPNNENDIWIEYFETKLY